MAENFILSLEAVLPMFILMAVGVAVKRFRLLSAEEIKKLNHMVFVVFFPVLMFSNLYGTDIEEAVDGRLIAFGVTAVLLIYFATTAFVLAVEKHPRSRGAMIQAIYRSNFVIMGIPIAVNMFGHGNLAVTAMMVAIIIPLYNVLAVITLEIFRGSRPNFAHILRNLIKNPLIIGAVAGIAAVVSGIQLPEILEETTDEMAAVATPMALVILGASIDFRSMERCGRNLLICVAGRLLVVPAVGLTAAALLGFRGIAYVTLLAIFASPTAVSSFAMAEAMDSDGQLAGNCVVFSTAFACFTMFFWIFLSKSLGLF